MPKLIKITTEECKVCEKKVAKRWVKNQVCRKCKYLPKPSVCRVCNFKFANRSKLFRHLKMCRDHMKDESEITALISSVKSINNSSSSSKNDGNKSDSSLSDDNKSVNKKLNVIEEKKILPTN